MTGCVTVAVLLVALQITPTEYVTALAVAPSNDLLLVGTDQGHVRLWHLGDAKLLWNVSPSRSPITTVAFSTSSDSVLIGTDSGLIAELSRENGENVFSKELRGSIYDILSLNRRHEVLVAGGIQHCRDGTLSTLFHFRLQRDAETYPLQTDDIAISVVKGKIHNEFFSLSKSGEIIDWQDGQIARRQRLDDWGENLVRPGFDVETRRVIGVDSSGTPTAWSAKDGKVEVDPVLCTTKRVVSVKG
jgi:WD40 repeat protein